MDSVLLFAESRKPPSSQNLRKRSLIEGARRVAGWLFADSTLVIAMKKPQVAASPLTTHGGTFTIRIPLQQLHRQRHSEDLDIKTTQGKRDAS